MSHTQFRGSARRLFPFSAGMLALMMMKLISRERVIQGAKFIGVGLIMLDDLIEAQRFKPLCRLGLLLFPEIVLLIVYIQ